MGSPISEATVAVCDVRDDSGLDGEATVWGQGVLVCRQSPWDLLADGGLWGVGCERGGGTGSAIRMRDARRARGVGREGEAKSWVLG